MYKLSIIILFFASLAANAQPGGRHFASDPNAISFCNSASITDANLRGAIYMLAIDLKGAGVWSIFSTGAIYPAVGGNSTAHSYNLTNTANFQLTFTGSPTHSSTGILWNGTSQYASTGLIPDNISMGYNNFTLAYYSGTSTAGVDANSQFYDMGSGNQAHGGYSLWTRRQANTAATDAGSGDVSNRISVSNSDGSGMFIGSAVSSTGYLYRNGSQIATKSSLGSTNIIGAYSVFLGGFNEGNDAVVFYSNKEMRFAAIGTGLTTAQMAILSTIVNRYETKLGRNTY